MVDRRQLLGGQVQSEDQLLLRVFGPHVFQMPLVHHLARENERHRGRYGAIPAVPRLPPPGGCSCHHPIGKAVGRLHSRQRSFQFFFHLPHARASSFCFRSSLSLKTPSARCNRLFTVFTGSSSTFAISVGSRS